MDKNVYWHFIKEMWSQPENTTRRYVFADWLREHNCNRAANKQHMIAKCIDNAYVLYSFFLTSRIRRNNHIIVTKSVKRICGRMAGNKCFDLLKNGGISFHQTNNGHKKHIIKGKMV